MHGNTVRSSYAQCAMKSVPRMLSMRQKIVSAYAQHTHAIISKNTQKYQIKMQFLTINKRNFQKPFRNPSNRTKVKFLGKFWRKSKEILRLSTVQYIRFATFCYEKVCYQICEYGSKNLSSHISFAPEPFQISYENGWDLAECLEHPTAKDATVPSSIPESSDTLIKVPKTIPKYHPV
jgi:hypothetical protein